MTATSSRSGKAISPDRVKSFREKERERARKKQVHYADTVRARFYQRHAAKEEERREKEGVKDKGANTRDSSVRICLCVLKITCTPRAQRRAGPR